MEWLAAPCYRPLAGYLGASAFGSVSSAELNFAVKSSRASTPERAAESMVCRSEDIAENKCLKFHHGTISQQRLLE